MRRRVQHAAAAHVERHRRQETQLQAHRIDGLCGRGGAKVGEIVHLPAVGRNLQDRNEISVISETDKEFRTLRNVSFQPGDDLDPARLEWLEKQSGLYATNGGALAIFLSEH